MVRIIEVGPRDGLQNEATAIATPAKAAFIRALAKSGLREIEVTSFVSSKWVPQLGDAEALWPMLPEGPLYSALVPNLKGLERAVRAGVNRIALFTASSDAFALRNVNMTVDQSLQSCSDVIASFRERVHEGWVRGYVSTAFECPYAGRMDPKQTVSVVRRLLETGVDEVCIGDTIGVAVPQEVAALTPRLLDLAPASKLAYHFHDTRGTAIANVAAALELGITSFDASGGGLGGCPYAPGAGGNLATEDLVYFLERSGIDTGVSMPLLAMASLSVLEILGRAPVAKAQVAALAESPPR